MKWEWKCTHTHTRKERMAWKNVKHYPRIEFYNSMLSLSSTSLPFENQKRDPSLFLSRFFFVRLTVCTEKSKSFFWKSGLSSGITFTHNLSPSASKFWDIFFFIETFHSRLILQFRKQWSKAIEKIIDFSISKINWKSQRRENLKHF